MKKAFRTMRVYKEDDEKFNELVSEITGIEKRKVSKPEAFRRILNIPINKDILKQDAFLKRRFRI